MEETLKRMKNWCKNLVIGAPKYFELCDQYYQKECAKYERKMNIEFGKKQEEAYKEAFNRAIEKFYGDHEPDYYDRSEGLYKAWESTMDEGNMVTGSVEAENDLGFVIDFDMFVSANLDGGKTTPMRDGGVDSAKYLFDQAFNGGWHGGAKTINDPTHGGYPAEVWGAHPSPGTPHYRKPGVVHYPDGTTKRHQFAKWGKRAERMSEAPRLLFEKYINEANTTVLIAEDERLFEKYDKIVSKKCNDYNDNLLAEMFPVDWLE